MFVFTLRLGSGFQTAPSTRTTIRDCGREMTARPDLQIRLRVRVGILCLSKVTTLAPQMPWLRSARIKRRSTRSWTNLASSESTSVSEQPQSHVASTTAREDRSEEVVKAEDNASLRHLPATFRALYARGVGRSVREVGAHARVRAHTHACIHTYAHTYARTHTHARVCANNISTNIRAHAHARTHARTH